MSDYEITKAYAPKGGPYASLQWKGTDACIDFKCSCGEGGHIDGDFLYRLRCGACGKVYACSPYITLIEVSEDSSMDCVTGDVLMDRDSSCG